MYKRIVNNHTCMFCGTDISHKIKKALVCDNPECYKKLQQYEEKTKNDKRFCIICGVDITHLRKQRKTCDNPECYKQYKKDYYKNLLYNKTCKHCGKDYIGTAKSTVCEECKQIKYPTKQEKIQQTVICKQCGCTIDVREKFKSSRVHDIIYDICKQCKDNNKKLSYQQTSDRMKQNNPMYNKETAIKVGNTLRQNYINKCIENNITPHKKYIKKDIPETKEETKIRMSQQNPMHNKDSVEKMKQTLQKHIADGTIIYKHGKDHWLWKGNRNLNKAVRIALRKWVKYMFEKYNYTCQKCGKQHTELHTHHIEPLRDIIQKYLTKYGYTTELLQENEGSEIYLNFIQKIVNYHYDNPNIGIVVCPDCHAILDKQYRKRKK